MFQGQLLDLIASGRRLRHFRSLEELEDTCDSVMFEREQQEERLQRNIEWERVEAHPKKDQICIQDHMEHVKSSPLMAEH